MNLDTFLTSSQDELVAWVTDSAEAYNSQELDLTDESAVTNEDLIFSLAVYKALDSQGLTVPTDNYQDFMVSAEEELRRRYAV